MNRNEAAQALLGAMRKEISNIHTASPGVILEYDGHTATVQPSLMFNVPDGRSLPMPAIVGVPVVFPSGSGGDASVTFPVRTGDGCLIVFAEGAIDEWLKGGESGDPRRHDMSDAIAIPGLFNFSLPAVNEHPNDVCLKNHSTMLRIEAGGAIHIDGSDLIVDGISFKQHVHPESIGTQTGPPK